MEHTPEQIYLLTRQYQNGTRLSARGYLHARFSTNSYGWFLWLFDHLHLPPQSNLLELGCGLGWLWKRNLARIPAGWNITLSDFSQGMLDEAGQQLQNGPHPFSFAIVDAQAIPYPDKSFDAVIANHMLYHVPDHPRAFAEIRRVLKSGGYFYASTVGVNHLHELVELFPEYTLDARRRFSFTLENGGGQLAPYFAHISLHRYDDTLVVTEAEPLVSYLLSLSPNISTPDDTRVALIRRTQDLIIAQGAIRLTNDFGLFEAW